jgi:hypothetical protein
MDRDPDTMPEDLTAWLQEQAGPDFHVVPIERDPDPQDDAK